MFPTEATLVGISFVQDDDSKVRSTLLLLNHIPLTLNQQFRLQNCSKSFRCQKFLNHPNKILALKMERNLHQNQFHTLFFQFRFVAHLIPFRHYLVYFPHGH